MIHALTPYPAMKDSGVPWLGQVPEHWNVTRSKWLFASSKELAHPDDIQLSATQAYGVIPQEEYERLSGARVVKISMHLDKRKHVEKDDFIISMRSFQGGLERAWASGAIRSSYVVLKPGSGVNVGFFSYLLKSHDYIRALQVTGGFIRDGQDLTESNFREVDLPLVPPDEQAAIVRYLDHADRRIRRTIAAKQKLIKLLQEQKQVIIHQAVTRGLDPDVKLKPSGVEWFPIIPSHWQALPMRRVISRAVDGPHFSPDYLDSGIPFLSARNVKVDKWNLDDAKYISEADYKEFSKRVIPMPGDVLYTKGGTTGVARAVDLDFPFQVWVHIAVLKVKKAVCDPKYLANVLNSPYCYEQSQLFTRGATNQDLGLGRMKDIIFPLPPLIEQRAITMHIEQFTKNVSD